MLLSQLPPSTLDLIFGNESSSYLIVKLWKTGDRLLRDKLARGITYVDLRHHKWLKPSYPHFLSQLLKLRSLKIRAVNRIFEAPLSSWKDVLSRLPATLESFSLHSNDSDFSILSGQPEGPRLLPLLEMFPRLQTLRLTGNWPYRAPNSPGPNPAGPHDFQELPSSLTCLGWNDLQIDREHPSFFAHLPRSLTSLECHIHLGPSSVPHDWSLAPPNLSSVPDWSIAYMDPNGTPLPATITNSFARFTAKISETAHLLPPSMARLDLYQIHFKTGVVDDWMRLLPKNILEMAIYGPQESLFSSAHILAVPRTLTRLDLSRIAVNPKDHEGGFVTPDMWPPQLVSFSCRILDLVPGFLASLPRSLTLLDFMLFSRPHAEILFTLESSELPPKLSKLNVAFQDSAKLFINGMLPETLKEVNWNHGKGLNEEHFRQFPSSLTSIYACLAIHRECPVISSLFPAHLSCASLTVFHASWIHAVPKTLVKLVLYSIHSATKAEFNYFCENLPTNLEMVHLCSMTGAIDFVGSSNAFSNLPKLTSLNVSERVSFRSDILRRLPRQLKDITMVLESLAEEDIAFMPPQLESIYFKRFTVPNTPLLARHWPIYSNDLPEPHKSIVLQRLREKLSS